MNKILEIRKITKKYNNIPVVNSISFVAKPCEILGYLGPNGAGKTTTIKMLSGLLEPNSGQILFNGSDIDQNIFEYKKRIGYIPEQAELYSHLSGKEYLQLVGRLRLIPEKILNKKIDYLMEQLGLSIDMNLPISNYSKGMRQKILIVASLIHNPDILLLDEPLSGLDTSTMLIFKDILSQFSKQGKIIIYSSHILEVVEKICDRVIIIDKGVILADNSVTQLKDLMQLPSLESIFKRLVHYENLQQIAENIISAIKNKNV
jgi:ABC-2 type transport system ATP-binding protein